MTISFNLVPSDIRVPGSYIEFDGSKALSGLPAVPLKIILVGQKIAAGTAVPLVPVRISSKAEGMAAFGRGSLGALMVTALKDVNDKTECWAVPIADEAGGVLAAGTLTVTGPATAAGTIALYIAGKRFAVGVAAAATAATVAAAIVAKVNADPDVLVTAAAVAGVVTLTARNKGTAGNDIDLRHSYYQGEALPAGIGMAIVAMTGGATDPDLTAVWAALADTPYDMVVLPYADGATLTGAAAEMERRAGPLVALDGVAVAGKSGTQGALLAFGSGRNDKTISLIGAKASPTHPCAFAAAYYGTVLYHAAIDPARPFQTLSVAGVIPPALNDRFTAAERDQLLRDGISTFAVDAGGIVLIERPITTYQTNAQAIDDPSWLDINVNFLLAYIRRVWRARYASKFPRHKLADDGANFAAGQAVVTPSVLRAENVSLYRSLEEAGLVDDMNGFKRDMIVERNTTYRDRVDQLLPVRLIGAFRVQAAKFEYRL